MPVHEDVSEKAVVDVSPVGHNMNRASVKYLLKPLFGCWALEFCQLRCVDTSKSNPLASHAKGVAIDDLYLERAQQ